MTLSHGASRLTLFAARNCCFPLIPILSLAYTHTRSHTHAHTLFRVVMETSESNLGRPNIRKES